MKSTNEPVDLIVAGGGLSGLLTAWFRLIQHPSERAVVLEAAHKPAGNHTWSFNLSDIPGELLPSIQQIIAYQWPSYEVRFPEFERRVESAYATSNSHSLLDVLKPLTEAGRLEIRTGTSVRSTEPTQVLLENGECFRGRAVVDARGGPPGAFAQLGYQKFAGLTVRTHSPHGLSVPLLMDATVRQEDGYRFLYCLPFSETDILIEDTCYSDDPTLDRDGFQRRVCDYAAERGWAIQHVLRSESGVLPITLTSDVEAALRFEAGAAPKIGLAGGIFHATTGYSLPDATRLAAAIAHIETLSAHSVARTVAQYRRAHGRREIFYRRLNRMLFQAAVPERRYKVLQRFFQLDDALIQRFFASSLTFRDKARILCGRPPVPLIAAMRVMKEQHLRRQTHAAF